LALTHAHRIRGGALILHDEAKPHRSLDRRPGEQALAPPRRDCYKAGEEGAMVAWTLVFHILGIVAWVGGLLVTTLALAQRAGETSAEAQAGLMRLAEKIVRTMVHPGAIVTILSGLLLIATHPSYYLHAFWLDAKLVLVLILVVLNAVALARLRALRAGRAIPRREFVLLHVLVALVFLSILIAVLPGGVYFH